MRQLQNLGIDPPLLNANNARAIGVVSKINTAVLKVPAADASVPWRAAPEAFAQKAGLGQSNDAKPSRDLSLKEFGAINLVGVVGSLLAGVLFGSPLLGILGIYVAAIPLIFAYVGIKRLSGDNVKIPEVRFSPGVSWAGKEHSLLPRKSGNY